jgi:hypothetical protein
MRLRCQPSRSEKEKKVPRPWHAHTATPPLSAGSSRLVARTGSALACLLHPAFSGSALAPRTLPPHAAFLHESGIRPPAPDH